ncbi:MAG: type II secretion system F family protein [Bacillota bacterium]
MIELKFTAQKSDGQLVGGIITADSLGMAKEKVRRIAAQNNFHIKRVEKKGTYYYKVRKGNSKPLQGEQRAFNTKEVIEVLTKLGYEVISVHKKIFEWNSSPSQRDILLFLKVSTDMIEQNLSYGEILNFLINDTRNKVLKDTLADINKELKKGSDSEQVFMKHQHIFGRFVAFMLGLASKSGNMAEIYKATVKFMERRVEFKKNLRSALITPMVTLIILFGVVIWYVAYIFPETAKMFMRFQITLPPMTAFTLKMSEFLQSNIIIISLLVILPILFLIVLYRHPRGRVIFDKYLFKIPYLGDIIHRTVIEIFCRVFYTLYSSSAESISPIKVAAEATGNRYFEEQVKLIALPLMRKKGIGISDGLIASGVFPETAISKFRAGEETGNIKSSALQLANYYESDTVYRLKNFVEWVQIDIAIIITVIMILLTIVSAETAVIKPKKPRVMDRTATLIEKYVEDENTV